ncbi:TlpA family protein disulfide reductase [Agromyces ramosus]|uniref:Thiol-disulfide isomerase/thioredoxin n=1 Tax=Agromyces ramosus TaxID=33879 RepID=A0ABU0RDS1_9MICO|nr:TlpA disulfide reductase family protein [Agromyces ramosus]MDQ0895932.1 thiol-disulfide isomerase/thioredoxin [Agromyces ramosus]
MTGIRPIAVIGTIAALILALTACATGIRGGAAQLPAPLPEGTSYTPGTTGPAAPALDGILVDDTPVDLDALAAGRPLIVQFMASWCSSCAEQQSVLSRVAAEYGDAIAIAQVSGDTDAAALAGYLDAHQVAQPVLVDHDLQIWRSYAVTEPPMTALIDSEGHLLKLWPSGADEQKLREQLDRIVPHDG